MAWVLWEMLSCGLLTVLTNMMELKSRLNVNMFAILRKRLKESSLLMMLPSMDLFPVFIFLLRYPVRAKKKTMASGMVMQSMRYCSRFAN